MGEINFNNVFSVAKYIPNITILMDYQSNVINEGLFFSTKYLTFFVYFIFTAHFNSD